MAYASERTISTIKIARSILFVPGNRPERFSKALDSGADAVIIDLEDAVSSDSKAPARDAIARAWSSLSTHECPCLIRINPVNTADGMEDLRWLEKIVPCPALVISKAESARDLTTVRNALPHSPLLPLIESAAGLHRLTEIAAHEAVVRLVVGHIDFMADTGIQCSEDESELDIIRFTTTIQSRLHGLPAPVDGVTTALDDSGRLRADTARASRFGFGGKLCIHPKQVKTVHETFAPSAQELVWARRVIDGDQASGGAAFRMDDSMVDRPIVLRALRTLGRARK